MVNARELHQFLENKSKFADWIKKRIDKYNFLENQDFIIFHKVMKTPQDLVNSGRPVIEYLLSVDMAKEICMLEANDKGQQARRYYIACVEILGK